MRKLIALLLLLALPAYSATRISYSVIVSNTPVTSNTITLNSTTLIWSNTSASVYIPTNLTSTAAATTNLANKLASYPLNPPLAFQWISSTNFRLYAPLGSAFSASSVGGWAVLIVSNQAGPATYTALWPFENMAGDASNRVNQASAFVQGQSTYSTQAFATNATAVSNLLHKGAGPRQRVLSEVEYQTLLAAAYAQLTNANLVNATNSGYLSAMTNGYWTNGIAEGLTVTNLNSPGAGSLSQRLGANSSANGVQSLALGQGSTADTNSGTAVGTAASAFGIADTALASGAESSGGSSLAAGAAASTGATNAVAIGARAVSSFQNSAAIGPDSITTKSNQIMLGTSSRFVTVPGVLEVSGTQTNVTLTGTNSVAGSMAWARFDLSTLANGNNISVPFGTNKFIRLSGTLSSAASICGIIGGATSGGQNGQEVNVLNDTGFTVTFEVNTVDPVTANRISTQTGLGVAIPDDGWCSLFYDSSAARWKVKDTFPTVVSVTNYSILTNDLVLNAYNTNASQRAMVYTTISMTNILATDKSMVALYLDQDGDGTWEMQGISCTLQGVALLAGREELSAAIQPNARFMVTNLSTGTASASIIPNSSQVVRQ